MNFYLFFKKVSRSKFYLKQSSRINFFQGYFYRIPANGFFFRFLGIEPHGSFRTDGYDNFLFPFLMPDKQQPFYTSFFSVQNYHRFLFLPNSNKSVRKRRIRSCRNSRHKRSAYSSLSIVLSDPDPFIDQCGQSGRRYLSTSIFAKIRAISFSAKYLNFSFINKTSPTYLFTKKMSSVLSELIGKSFYFFDRQPSFFDF